MGEGRGNLKGCFFWGCGVILLIPVLAAFSVMVRTWVPLRTAEASQDELEQQFGAPGSFTPAPDGEIPLDRLERFLQVRGAMMELCPEFESLEATIEEFSQEVSEKERPTGKELFKVGRFLVVALGDLTPLVGQFFRQRNEALLESGMGIGEYVYLFTVAHGDRLAEEHVKAMLFAGGESLSTETGRALRSMLANQRRGLEPADGADGFRSTLDLELSALQNDPGRLPWQDSLSNSIERSLAPFRERLDAQFCPETAVMGTDLTSDRAMALALE